MHFGLVANIIHLLSDAIQHAKRPLISRFLCGLPLLTPRRDPFHRDVPHMAHEISAVWEYMRLPRC